MILGSSLISAAAAAASPIAVLRTYTMGLCESVAGLGQASTSLYNNKCVEVNQFASYSCVETVTPQHQCELYVYAGAGCDGVGAADIVPMGSPGLTCKDYADGDLNLRGQSAKIVCN